MVYSNKISPNTLFSYQVRNEKKLHDAYDIITLRTLAKLTIEK